MSNLGNKAIMAKNIQYYMDMHDKTRNEMCEALGVKYTTFTDWVKGNSYPRIDKIELMANYFGISKADLVEEHTESQEPWQPTITEKDERDIKKKLDNLINQLSTDTGLMYDGEPMDEESLAAVRAALEVAERTAMLEARRKFTPDKYKK